MLFLSALVNALYPHNPDAVHSRLQTMFDKLDDMKENERQIITTMFHTVSQKHPEVSVFTKTIGTPGTVCYISEYSDGAIRCQCSETREALI